MNRILRTAAVAAALLAGATTANADTSGVEAAGTQVGKVMAHDQILLLASGARIAELTDIVRPKSREDADVTLSTRDIADAPVLAQPATLDVASLDAMPKAAGGADMQCLAQAIYFESRGEPLAGQIAVAEVVLNRVDDRRFPKTVCGVTNQSCQFSYTCDGNSDTMKSAVARDRSEKLASLMLNGRARTVAGGATYFHSRSVRPDWSHRFTRTTSIGHHIFYRPATRVAGG